MNNAQPDLFANQPRSEQLPPVDQNVIRARMMKMLAEIRAATTKSPWDARDTLVNCQIFPQIGRLLPLAEANQLRAEFLAELNRLNIPATNPLFEQPL